MAVLPVTAHSARWDLEDAMRQAGIDLALLDAYEQALLDAEHPAAELEAACKYRVVAP